MVEMSWGTLSLQRRGLHLYHEADKEGQTLEFMLSTERDVSAARRFFKKVMRAEQRRLPFPISVDKNAAYPDAFTSSQDEKSSHMTVSYGG